MNQKSLKQQQIQNDATQWKFPNTIEGKALEIFANYIASHNERFDFIKEDGNIANSEGHLYSDIHEKMDGYNSVFADFVVIDKKKPKSRNLVFFEVKGTSQDARYWGGVTLKELDSARKHKGNYFFAVICTKKKKFIHDPLVNQEDPYGVFMDLERFLYFSTRTSLSIQFTIRFPKKAKGELLASNNGESRYSPEKIDEILNNDYIKSLIYKNDSP